MKYLKAIVVVLAILHTILLEKLGSAALITTPALAITLLICFKGPIRMAYGARKDGNGN